MRLEEAGGHFPLLLHLPNPYNLLQTFDELLDFSFTLPVWLGYLKSFCFSYPSICLTRLSVD